MEDKTNQWKCASKMRQNKYFVETSIKREFLTEWMTITVEGSLVGERKYSSWAL